MQFRIDFARNNNSVGVKFKPDNTSKSHSLGLRMERLEPPNGVLEASKRVVWRLKTILQKSDGKSSCICGKSEKVSQT